MTAKDLIKVFSNHYCEKVGERYPPTWGRDVKMFTQILEQFNGERITDLLHLYFSTPRRIYSIPFFKVALAELLQVETKENKFKPKPMQDNESWRFE